MSFSNTSSTDPLQLSVNHFTLHYLMANSFHFGQSLDVAIDKLSLIWVSTMYCKLSKKLRQKNCVFVHLVIPRSHVGIICAQSLRTIINFFHWMIVVCSGQVFKHSQKVFKYQHQYLLFKQYLNTDINCSISKSF